MRRVDRVSQIILIILIVLVAVRGAVLASQQSQEFLNGTFFEGIKALGTRMDRIENAINYVLTASVGALIVQLLQIRMSVKRRNRRDQARGFSDDDE